MDKAVVENEEPSFLRGGGETGKLILNYDWSQSPLGQIRDWPQSLKTNLGNILHSGFPMVLFWGPQNICFYNDAYRPSLGADGKHPAIGKQAQQVWPEIWELISTLIHNVYASSNPQWYENRLVPIYRNGKLEDAYWTFSYSPAYGENDTIAGVLVTCVETTQTIMARKKIEETVAERTRELERANQSIVQANRYLQHIINSFKQPLQVLEPVFEHGKIIDFRFKLTNAAYAAYAGATPEEIQYKRVGEIFPGYFKTSSFTNVVKTFESGLPDTWVIHYDQDGLDLYNEMTAIKMGNEVILHFADFTKLKYLELQLLKKIEELEFSNQNLDAFARAASHDLKEPVRKIQIFTSRLRHLLSVRLSPEEREPLEKIETSSARMAVLIDDLLQFSQVNLVPLEKERVDLNEKLNLVLEDLEMDIQEKKALINAEQLPVVNGYGRQLQQMLQNLISNALKYQSPHVPPQIQILTRTHQENGTGYHVIEIKDNGIGFEQQFADQIFQLFTRLHSKSKYAGSGVGLSIVKKVVDNHQGLIEVESKPGEGTSFRVLLPEA